MVGRTHNCQGRPKAQHSHWLDLVLCAWILVDKACLEEAWALPQAWLWAGLQQGGQSLGFTARGSCVIVRTAAWTRTRAPVLPGAS